MMMMMATTNDHDVRRTMTMIMIITIMTIILIRSVAVQANQLKIFDPATGLETASFPGAPHSTSPDPRPSSSSSSPPSSRRPSTDVDDQPLVEPHGVCADRRGLVFVADRRAHAVRVFDERCGGGFGVQGAADGTAATGRSLASYDDERHRIGLPFAVACNQRDQLAVVDYVGTVRVYNYFDDKDFDC